MNSRERIEKILRDLPGPESRLQGVVLSLSGDPHSAGQIRFNDIRWLCSELETLLSERERESKRAHTDLTPGIISGARD